MGVGALGAAALRDRDFVASLGRGRNPQLRTVDSVLAVMGEPPAGPAFLGEVEAFLAVTGIKRSLLGRGATGNPSFVAQLRKGVSPTLVTVTAVRAWMASHASAGEWREIRARTGPWPWYYRFGGCVRYRETDLVAWDAGRRHTRGREASRQASP